MIEENLTQTELDFKASPNKVLEVTLDLISALVIISGKKTSLGLTTVLALFGLLHPV